MIKPRHLLLCMALFSCRNATDSKLNAENPRSLAIFTDAVSDGMTLKKWPIEGTQVEQSTVPVDGRGKVWEIETTDFGVAHVQFNNGPRSLTDFQRLKFDLRVVTAGTNEALIKLGGLYPARAEYKLKLDGGGAPLPECAGVQPVIDNAIKFGEIEALKQSSDPLIAKCAAQSGTSGWKSYSIEFKDLLVIEGFKLANAIDPFVIELGRGMQVQLDNIRLEGEGTSTVTPPPPPGSILPSGAPSSFASLGDRVGASVVNNVAITEGVIRVRRRHENDMDFAKFNPFYWQGRLTSFKIEDFTQAGENRIKFTMKTEWPQDYTPNRGPDFSAIYKGDPAAPSETLRSKFAINKRMSHIADFRVFEGVIGPEDFAAFSGELKKGALLVFEVRFFNNETFPDWAKQKAANPHTISAYYSEFFRIRIGEAGLFIDNPNDPNALPLPARYSGGWATSTTTRVEPWKGLQQQVATLIPNHHQDFLNGRTWFHTDMTSGQHVSDESDDKPSVFFEDMRLSRSGYAATAFNVHSCSTCHVRNGIALLPAEGAPVHTTVVKTMNKQTGLPHAQFGDQLQTDGTETEGTLKVVRYETVAATFNDGSNVTLKKPIFVIENPAFPIQDVALSPRRTPAMIGMGLLNAVAEETIRGLASKNGGKIRMINGKVGRFGWKAGQPTLQSQIMGALANDMSVSSSGRPALDCAPRCKPGKAPLPDQSIKEMTSYLSLLGVPPRNNPNDALVLKGETIFKQMGCQNCHVPTLRTGTSEFAELSNQTIQPFTDLLLHDMGPGLADNDAGEFAKTWRTAPLWGLKNVKHATNARIAEFPPGLTSILSADTQRVANTNAMGLLHDGRAANIPEAILWHGGEAETAVKLYKALTKADRDALEAFLLDL